jgi:ubiquinone/menaquinone biosynthesis C-methylase UbiE
MSIETLRYADYYDRDDGDLAEWRCLSAIEKSRNIVDLCSSAGSLLDIGCGDGAVSRRLKELKFAEEYHAADVSVSAVKRARAYGIDAVQTDGATLPFEDETFDLAILSHVVEHLEHPRQTLYEAKRVARRVFVEVPCEHNIRMPADYAPNDHGHINFYTPKTIRHLVQSCGLRVTRQVTRGVSAELSGGRLKHAIRETALAISPAVATRVFCYHTALVCEG